MDLIPENLSMIQTYWQNCRWETISSHLLLTSFCGPIKTDMLIDLWYFSCWDNVWAYFVLFSIDNLCYLSAKSKGNYSKTSILRWSSGTEVNYLCYIITYNLDIEVVSLTILWKYWTGIKKNIIVLCYYIIVLIMRCF